MSGNLHVRLHSLGGDGCPVEVLSGKMIYRQENEGDEFEWSDYGGWPSLTGRGPRRLGDWFRGTRDAAE